MCVCWQGVNDDGVPYERALCAESKPRGVMILGDSAGAHFHIPPEYLYAPLLSQVSFINVYSIGLSVSLRKLKFCISPAQSVTPQMHP